MAIKDLFKQNLYEMWIASRYIRLKNKNNFISFISLTSIVGITLGVMSLIVVLSVMNGFQSELQSRIISVSSDIEIRSSNYNITNWQKLKNSIQGSDNIISSAPFSQNQAMIAMGKFNRGVIVRGILPEIELDVSDLQTKIIKGSFTLTPESFDIIIGSDLARHFGLNIGDKTSIISSQANYSPLGMLPRVKQFRVSGIFDVGMYEYDAGLVLINLHDAQKFFQMDKGVSGLRVKLNDLGKTKLTVENIERLINQNNNYFISDWTKQHSNLFAAIQMEKKVMFIILTLIIAVAAFNIVSTLVMGVTEKRSDIAILRTLGASQKSILLIFMSQGLMIGLIGTFLGIIFGVIISVNIGTIIPFIESLFGVEFLSPDVYYISELPSQLLMKDVISIGLMGVFLSFIATIYPSMKAAQIDPAIALKHE
ncbi:MAG: lipoprotein-releasing ABC transporter permease subunit [Methylophilales bacterium]|nr:lipoprotein-releasing ABC transporter permease subunit [Methylophilales bacterium]